MLHNTARGERRNLKKKKGGGWGVERLIEWAGKIPSRSKKIYIYPMNMEHLPPACTQL